MREGKCKGKGKRKGRRKGRKGKGERRKERRTRLALAKVLPMCTAFVKVQRSKATHWVFSSWKALSGSEIIPSFIRSRKMFPGTVAWPVREPLLLL